MKGTAAKISTSAILNARFFLHEGTCLRSCALCRTAFLKTHLLSREQRLYHEDKVQALGVIRLDGARSALSLRRRILWGTGDRVCY